MTIWVALLRGVNVNGITVRSADLRTLFGELGFADVRTVRASGNIVFTSPGTTADLKTQIETALRDRFDYDAWIVLVTRTHLEEAIAGFPFDAADAARQPYVIFASDPAALDELAHTTGLDEGVDPIARGADVVYWNPVKGTTLDTPFGKVLARKTYRQTTTNRNLRTLRAIIG